LTSKRKYDIINIEKRKEVNKMKIAKQWLLENRGIEIPTGEVSAEWFIDNDLPMVVSCSCCETTMVLPSAMVDDDGYIYCGSCAE
jgi:hypothetical protein